MEEKNIYVYYDVPDKNLQKSPVLLSAHVKRFRASRTRYFYYRLMILKKLEDKVAPIFSLELK